MYKANAERRMRPSSHGFLTPRYQSGRGRREMKKLTALMLFVLGMVPLVQLIASRFRAATCFLILILLGMAPLPAQAQTAGGACTTGYTAGPDVNGNNLKCVASVWTVVSSGGGTTTVIEPKCGYNNSSCTPPSCPSGWTDQAVTNTETDYEITSWYIGYQSRICTNSTAYAVMELKCGYRNSACTPASCPSGWTDLGITNTAYQFYDSGWLIGWQSRYCIK